jgi:hypothetical protein
VLNTQAKFDEADSKHLLPNIIRRVDCKRTIRVCIYASTILDFNNVNLQDFWVGVMGRDKVVECNSIMSGLGPKTDIKGRVAHTLENDWHAGDGTVALLVNHEAGDSSHGVKTTVTISWHLPILYRVSSMSKLSLVSLPGT